VYEDGDEIGWVSIEAVWCLVFSSRSFSVVSCFLLPLDSLLASPNGRYSTPVSPVMGNPNNIGNVMQNLPSQGYAAVAVSDLVSVSVSVLVLVLVLDLYLGLVSVLVRCFLFPPCPLCLHVV
jgi:hypothetical protein